MSGFFMCEANHYEISNKSIISLYCHNSKTSAWSILFYGYLGASSQFKKQSYSSVDSLGTAYDYQSMMHYNWNAFGRQNGDFGLQTIRTKDRSKQWLLGQRDGFSKIDVIQINKLYQCRGMRIWFFVQWSKTF